ncbi:MAG TPA: TetR/AcrR family transcriptional regulator [Ktedonosporobacter sp.]|nr:TetR/AcrR family transcriptional regulator [Ktedonosporobacter sp.]
MSRIDIHTARRAQIIDAAERLVVRQGWEETTFADICREAGISNGVLTYHFKDKDEIMLAVYERLATQLHDEFFSILQAQQSYREKIALVAHHICYPPEGKRELQWLLMHFLSLSAHHPEIAQRLQGVFSQTRQRNAAEVKKEMSSDSQKDPELIAGVIQCLVFGLSLGRMALGVDFSNEQWEQEVTAILLGYLDRGSEKNAGRKPEQSHGITTQEEISS